EYRYFYHYPCNLDLEKMQLGANLLLGTHDFSAFATQPETNSCVRTVTSISLTQKQDKIVFQVEGNGFLRYMVRTIVGTLLEVGRGKIVPENISNILASGERSKAGATAPACGLTLLKVNY
ncbi:MAG: pseudouridylate synthase I, partial [bacterium]